MPATVPHDMATTNRGKLIASERAQIVRTFPTSGWDGKGPGGLDAANISEHPDHFTTGPNGGSVGGTDPCNNGATDWE